MQNPFFTIRPLQLTDLKDGMQLSTSQGWNQTERDWKFLIEDPQNICLAAEENKKVIGTTTAINYSNKIAWIGMVLVKKEFRGMGVSKLLLTNVVQNSGLCKSIKLDATEAGKQVYKKFGFENEYLITRMISSSINILPPTCDVHISAEPIQLENINEIIAFDESGFGANRRQLIKRLVKEFPNKAWSLRRNDQLTGFILGRDGDKYHHIGPVLALTTRDAKILISKALHQLNSDRVIADVLNDKEELTNWLYSIGFVKQRHFMRMYKNENLFESNANQYHLICGPEFG